MVIDFKCTELRKCKMASEFFQIDSAFNSLHQITGTRILSAFQYTHKNIPGGFPDFISWKN